MARPGRRACASRSAWRWSRWSSSRIAENARIPVDNPATHLELTMVHEAMVLEYSGRHLAMIELAASLKLLLYVSLIACIFVPWGIAAAEARAGRLRCVGLAALSRQARAGGGVLLAVFETSIAKMRVFRVPRLPRRGADAGPARHAPALRLEEPLMDGDRLRHRASARRRAGAGQLHAALPGPALRAAQRLRAARPGAGALGRLAGLCPGRAASLRHGGDRAGLQGA